MKSRIQRFFTPPVFPADEEKTRSAAFIHAIGLSTIVIVIGLLLMRVVQRQDVNLLDVNMVLITVLLAIGSILYLTHHGWIRAASILLVVTLWFGLTYIAWTADGIRDVTFFGYVIPILLAGLLLGWRGAIFVILSSIGSGWALAIAETYQLIDPTLDTPLHIARDSTGIFMLIGVLIYLTLSSLENTLNKYRTVARDLAETNREVNDLRMDLEQRVEERTSELEKRATQLEAVAAVARTIASVQDLDTLLPAVTELVSQQFGFYHVGIFLLEEQTGQVVLRASSSKGGLLLIDQHFSLTPDEHSIVGSSISQRQPHIAPDVNTDANYQNNPNLAETLSEIALPLQVAGRVIGSLDVQSRERNAFSATDIRVLSTLADQIAIAIENARLFGEARTALQESKTLFKKYTRQEWRNFARQTRHTGYLFDGKQVTSLESHMTRESTNTAIQTGRLTLEKESASIAIPIKLRGETIGVLDVRSKRGKRAWKQDEIAMLEAAAERAALALENARLVESAQRRAARERAIGDISAKIGSASNLESILQTAVEELGRKIGGAAEVTLEIESDESDRQQDLYR
jgi:GAF domain-containing protein